MWFFPRHDITMKYVGNLRLVVAPLVISYGILLAPNTRSFVNIGIANADAGNSSRNVF